MSETQVSDPQPEVSFDETIDSIAAEFKPAEPKPAEPVAPTPVAPAVPDPLDNDQFSKYVEGTNNQVSALQHQVQALSDTLSATQQSEKQRLVEGDIKSAVSQVNKDLGFKDSMVRAHLEATASDNPSFLKIWDNRSQNPAAFKKALNAVREQIKKDWAVVPDSNILEGQEAVKTSQQAMATKATKGDMDDQFSKASDAEFDLLWAKARGGL